MPVEASRPVNAGGGGVTNSGASSQPRQMREVDAPLEDRLTAVITTAQLQQWSWSQPAPVPASGNAATWARLRKLDGDVRKLQAREATRLLPRFKAWSLLDRQTQDLLRELSSEKHLLLGQSSVLLTDLFLAKLPVEQERARLQQLPYLALARALEKNAGWKMVSSKVREAFLEMLTPTHPLAKRSRYLVEELLGGRRKGISSELQADALNRHVIDGRLLADPAWKALASQQQAALKKVVFGRDDSPVALRVRRRVAERILNDSHSVEIRARKLSSCLSQGLYETLKQDRRWARLTDAEQGRLATYLLASAPFRSWQLFVELNTNLTPEGKENSLWRLVLRLDLEASKGFVRMGSQEKKQLITLLSGQHHDLRYHARVALRKHSDWLAGSADEQRATLAKLLDSYEWLPYNSTESTHHSPQSYRLGPAREVQWRMFVAPAKKGGDEFVVATGIQRDVRIGRHVIPVVVPKKRGSIGHQHTHEEVAKALALLSDSTLVAFKRFTVNPMHHHLDLPYKPGPQPRVMMEVQSSGSVWIFPTENPTKPQSFASALRHEAAHVIAAMVLGNDYNNVAWRNWEKAIAADRLAPSQYGAAPRVHERDQRSTKLGEDFAETLELYLATLDHQPSHAEYRALWPNRFRILDRVWAQYKRQPTKHAMASQELRAAVVMAL